MLGHVAPESSVTFARYWRSRCSGIRSSLIITSNQPFSHWDQIFPDALMTVAAIDRIIHHAVIIEIDIDSYRRRNANTKKIN